MMHLLVWTERHSVEVLGDDRDRRIAHHAEAVDRNGQRVPFFDAVQQALGVPLHSGAVVGESVRRDGVKIRRTKCHHAGDVPAQERVVVLRSVVQVGRASRRRRSAPGSVRWMPTRTPEQGRNEGTPSGAHAICPHCNSYHILQPMAPLGTTTAAASPERASSTGPRRSASGVCATSGDAGCHRGRGPVERGPGAKPTPASQRIRLYYHVTPNPNYSDRRATFGSAPVARLAGDTLATNATASMTAPTARYTTGSLADC